MVTETSAKGEYNCSVTLLDTDGDNLVNAISDALKVNGFDFRIPNDKKCIQIFWKDAVEKH